MHTHLSRRTAALALGAAIIAVGVAATAQDKFNGTTIGDQWNSDATSPEAMTVSGGKLNFSSNSDFDGGIIWNQVWELSATKPWSWSFDYTLNPGSPPDPSGWAGILVPLSSPSIKTVGIGDYKVLALYRSASGTFLGELNGLYGGPPVPTAIASVPASGTIVVAYNARRDRMQVWVNNQPKVTYRRFAATYNPADANGGIILEGLTFAIAGSMTPADSVIWTHTNGMQVDNLRATGRGVVPAESTLEE